MITLPKKIVGFWENHRQKIIYPSLILLLTSASLFLYLEKIAKTEPQISALKVALSRTQTELDALKNQDQYKINQDLQARIQKVEDTYKKTSTAYEGMLDLKAQKQDTAGLDQLFVDTLNDLAKLNYASASSKLSNLNSEINKKYQSLAASAANPVPSGTVNKISAPTPNNTPPANGYGFQAVQTDAGVFNVAIVAADLNSTRVVIDTASDSDCNDNCPALTLGDYAARNGAYAGINGSFFCPAEYPSCAGKTNSFDTLLMNKDKVYFNSGNNVYSTVPLVYFTGNTMGVRGRSLDWGRDTGVDAVLANYPLYLSAGQIVYGGSGEAKLNNKGPRTFVANKGSFGYIGVIFGASAGDAAGVLKALGFDNALGLDQGGSTALWFNGSYKTGPGRNIPNALLFLRK